MLDVQPVAHELLAGGAFALGDFVFVMGKDQVDTTGMNVERLTEIFHRHRRAFDMPAGPATSDFRVPGWFVWIGWFFPKRKVARIFLLIFVGIDAFAATDNVAGKVDLRELAVFRKRTNPIVDRT